MATGRPPGRVRVYPILPAEEISALYAQGWTIRKLADRFHVPYGVMWQQLRDAGVAMRSRGPSKISRQPEEPPVLHPAELARLRRAVGLA